MSKNLHVTDFMNNNNEKINKIKFALKIEKHYSLHKPFIFFPPPQSFRCRHSGAAGIGDHKPYETACVHLSNPVRGHLESRIGNRVPDRKDYSALRPAVITNVSHLLSDCASPVEIR